MPKQRRIIIVAGPNGAGKTTFAREYLLKEAHCPDFVNVDLIAAGLSPFDPDRAAIRAGRIMLSEIERRVRKGESFAFETTLSGHVYARLIPTWRCPVVPGSPDRRRSRPLRVQRSKNSAGRPSPTFFQSRASERSSRTMCEYPSR